MLARYRQTTLEMLRDTNAVPDYKPVMYSRQLEAVVGADTTALIKAVATGRFKLTKLLVEGGTDVNTKDGDGRTALMAACLMKPNDDAETDVQLRLVKLLLKNGANVIDKDKNGKTALIFACCEKAASLEVVDILLSSDADPRTLDRSGSSALVHAVNAGNTDVLSSLVAACRAKGKEVIIITTKGRNEDRRDTRQYLDVPPGLVKTSPVYKCVAPRDIEYQLPVQTGDELFRGEGYVANERHNPLQLHSPDTLGDVDHPSRKLPTSLPSAPTYIVNRRESLDHVNMTSFSNILPEEPALDEEDGILHITDPTNATITPSSRERIFRRRESSDNVYSESNQGRSSYGGSASSMCSSCQSMASLRSNRSLNNSPEPRPPTSSPKLHGGRRRRSLPGMPPPLKKSQTIHAIRVPDHLLENWKGTLPARSCPDYLQDQKLAEKDEGEDESWDSGSSINSAERLVPRRVAGGRGKPLLQRRGSAPYLLDDELAQKRPGYLPPLKTNPDIPIPNIGCSFESISDDNKPRFSRLDRRCSFQADDVGRLTKLFDSSLPTKDSCSFPQDHLNGLMDVLR